MVLLGRLVEFLGLHRVITPGQHRFRSGHSTAMTVQDMVQRVRAAGVWNGRKATLWVFTDLKKASDILDHRILLAKLSIME
jgi:hypothetical protein